MTRETKEWRARQGRLQNELNGCLSELAELGLNDTDASGTVHQERLRGIAKRMNDIYSDDEFRHRNSEIVEVIHYFDREQTLTPEKALDKANERAAFLQDALKELLTHECTESCGDRCPIKQLRGLHRFERLYDQVRLEAKRTSYEHARATSILNQLTNAKTELDDARKVLKDAKKKARKASRQAKRLQAEAVSILGVFSAIILAFNASVTFTTSSISAVDTTPPFNVAFIVAIIGFVLFNCLYAAFAFIYRIVRPGECPDTIISAGRIAGIELTALACALVLGTLSYTYGMACWPEAYPCALAISFALLAFGIHLIVKSGNNCKEDADKADAIYTD